MATDPVVRLFNVYEKPDTSQGGINVTIPTKAAKVMIQIVYAGTSSGRYITRDFRQWFQLDPEYIQDGKVVIRDSMFPADLPMSGFTLALGYMTTETLKSAEEYGVEIPLSPVKSLAINERAFVVELDDGLRIAIDRSHFDTFAKQASSGVRSKVNFVTGETSSSNRDSTLNFADKGCSGCKKPNPFQG